MDGLLFKCCLSHACCVAYSQILGISIYKSLLNHFQLKRKTKFLLVKNIFVLSFKFFCNTNKYIDFWVKRFYFTMLKSHNKYPFYALILSGGSSNLQNKPIVNNNSWLTYFEIKVRRRTRIYFIFLCNERLIIQCVRN